MTSLTDAVDVLFQEWDTPHSPGCALLIAQHGEPLYLRGYGMANIEWNTPITYETIFHVGSVSKQFTAMVIALLAQDGKLSLDDDIRTYLTEIPDYGKPITIKQLIYQTHGMREQEELLYLAGWREHDMKTNTDAFRLIARQNRLNFQPGEKRIYNSSGYTCLALIAERVTGKSLREFANENIFSPLKMNHTHFHDDYTIPMRNLACSYAPASGKRYKLSPSACYQVGGAGLYTTTVDLLRWSENYYHCQIGGKAVIEQMLTAGRLNNGEPVAYAFGNSIGEYRGIKVLKHAGTDAGYNARVTWCPEHHFLVIILGNVKTSKPYLLANRIIDLYLEKYLQPPNPGDYQYELKITRQMPAFPSDPGILDMRQLSRYTGLYYSRELDVTYTLSQQAQQLLLKRLKFADSLLFCSHEDTFLFNGEDGWGAVTPVMLEFSRKGNSVNGFGLSSPNALDIWFEKIRN